MTEIPRIIPRKGVYPAPTLRRPNRKVVDLQSLSEAEREEVIEALEDALADDPGT